jgi:hypothetical protein
MIKVGVVFPSLVDDPGDYLADARALETAGIDSVWVPAATGGDLLLAAISTVTSRVRLGLLLGTTDEARPLDARLETLRRLSRSRVLLGIDTGDSVHSLRTSPSPLAGEGRGGGSSETWRHVTVPLDRAEWQQTLARAEAAGDSGVLVDQDPRLLDLLRRPLEEDDRSDLLLSQG